MAISAHLPDFQPPPDVATTSLDASHKRPRAEEETTTAPAHLPGFHSPAVAHNHPRAEAEPITASVSLPGLRPPVVIHKRPRAGAEPTTATVTKAEIVTTITALQDSYKALQTAHIHLQKRVAVMSADALTMEKQCACLLQRMQALCYLALYRLNGYPIDCFLREHDCPCVWSELEGDAYTLWDASGNVTTTTLAEIKSLPHGYSPVPTGLYFVPGKEHAFFTPLLYELAGLKEGPNFVNPYLFFYLDPLAPHQIQILVVRDKRSGICHFPCEGHGLYPMRAQSVITDQLKHGVDQSRIVVSDTLKKEELYRESTDCAFIQTNVFTIVSVTKQEGLPRSCASDQMEFAWITADRRLEREPFDTGLIRPHIAILEKYYHLLQPCIDRHIPSRTVTARPER